MLKQLINFYNPDQETKLIHIQSGKYDTITTKDKPELASWFCFKELGEIRFEIGCRSFSSLEIESEGADISLQEYFNEIVELRKEAVKYNLLIDIRDKRFDLTQAYFSIKKDYEKQYNVMIANHQLTETNAKLRDILSSSWMRSITEIHSMSSCHDRMSILMRSI